MSTHDAAAQLAAMSREELAALYSEVFETNVRGALVFEHLTQRFGRAKVHTSGGIDAVLRTFHEAARREVLDHIIVMCNLSRGVDDEPETPAEG
jgi:hypothetical protein